MLNIFGAVGLLVFTDKGLNAAQLIIGSVMLALGLFSHAQLKGRAPNRAAPARRSTRPLLPRVLSAGGLVLALAGIGWAKAEFREDPPNEFDAPEIEATYPYTGRGGGGMRVGLYRDNERLSWRVNSAGTDNCRPAGNSALWNFASGTTKVDTEGRFRAARTYFRPDRGLDGQQYEKQIDVRFRGRFTDTGGARGTYWRRDRYYQQNQLRFACARAGNWTASVR